MVAEDGLTWLEIHQTIKSTPYIKWEKNHQNNVKKF